MFDITLARVKAGWIGQVESLGHILWESDPFPAEEQPRVGDRLERVEDKGRENALNAARGKLRAVLEGLFAN